MLGDESLEKVIAVGNTDATTARTCPTIWADQINDSSSSKFYAVARDRWRQIIRYRGDQETDHDLQI